jgi:hypothetical protein
VITAAVLAVVYVAQPSAGLGGAGELTNLAPKATVSASSEYSNNYLARWAIDGKIPDQECRADVREAWCVRGQDGKHGQFTLTWPEPIEVAEIVYFGRTGMIVQECFKDYEVYLDAAAEPAKRGVLEMRHGPQRISIPKSTVREIRIKFLSAHKGAANPGASEIAVFGGTPGDAQLSRMLVPPYERTPESLRLRDDLLDGRMGFRDILLVKRHALNISHVYVYHVEGYQTGGGLYVYTPDADGGRLRCIVDS